MNRNKARWYRDLDILAILTVVALCMASFLAISSATHSIDGGTSYVVKQMVFAGVGFVAMLWLIRIDYRFLVRYAEILVGVLIALLIVVLFMPEINGAHGWIILPGGFSLQPSEFFKIAFILLMGKLLANEQEDEDGKRPDPLRNYLFLIGYGILGIGLIVIEPDLGQTIVLMSILGAAMFVHLPPKWFWSLVSLFLVFGILFGVCAFVFPDEFLHILDVIRDKGLLEDHQYERFESFIYPERDLANQGYQVYQAQVAIGSGQLFGKGLYQGSQTQGNWVPEQQTDFIFSVIGEELGFVGSVAVIFLFFLLVYRIITIGMQANDRTGMYICAMVAGMFAFQIFENIGMSLQLVPMTGVTLPFISYGGSSVLTNFILIGIVLNIGFRRRKLRF
ncbi:MAG TPA: FtsW/RodA/SpoVE family cell cycle protein [Bacilli bacterium]|nr:FtsW/RodA/SpoVE family cell cycle protein [Bacilli bacterium]